MEKLTNDFKIEFTKGDTYALAIKFKNITEDLRTAYFSVKENPDDEPLIQKSLGAGIDKIDDRGYKNEKTYKFQIQPADTVNLEPKVQYLYDIQVSVGNVVKTVLHGVFLLGSTITGTGATTQELEVAVDDELETEVLTTPATKGVEYEQDPVACAKIGDMATLSTQNKDTIVKAVNEVDNANKTTREEVEKIKNGTIEVPNAENAENAINAENATNAENAINAENATKINNLIIEKDENGVLKIGDIIIPQKKLLFSPNEWGVNEFTHTESLLNKKLEITLRLKTQTPFIMKFTEDAEYEVVNRLYYSGVPYSQAFCFLYSQSEPNKVSIKTETTNLSTGEVSTISTSIMEIYEIID